MTSYSTEMQEILHHEYQLKIYLDWLKFLKLENAKDNELAKSILPQFLELHERFYQKIPDHEILHAIHDFLIKLPSNLLSDEKKIKIPDVDNSHLLLDFSSNTNKLRIDTNVSLSLLRHFLKSNNDSYLLNTTAHFLTSLGIVIPFFNLLHINLNLLKKFFDDKKNATKTYKYDWYLNEKKYQLIKNILLVLLNTTNFIVSYFNLFSTHFYFSFASISLDYIFYTADFLKTAKFLSQEEQSFFQQLLLKQPNFSAPKNRIDLHQDLIVLFQSTKDEALKLIIIEILLTHQQQQINQDKFLFETLAFMLVFTSMIIMHSSGVLPIEQLVLMGLLSSYFYNVLKPYLLHCFIDLKNTTSIDLVHSSKEKISLKHGKIIPMSMDSHQQINPTIVFSLISKIIVPIIAISILPTLGPLELILLLSGSHLLINLIENIQPAAPHSEILEAEGEIDMNSLN